MKSQVLLVLCCTAPLVVDAYANIKDKDALIALYQNTGGMNWTLHDDAPQDDETLLPGGNFQWDLESDPCPLNHTEAWHGVGCIDPCYYPIDGEGCRFGRISGLQLGWNNLVGTIPEEVFDNLVNLTILDLAHNTLSGTIPTQVGKLRNIMIFQLNDNQLSGSIPTEIRTMSSHVAPDEMTMDEADLPAEALVNPGYWNGTIDEPNTMGLSQFDVSQNLLNGTIPTTIGELVHLQAVDVSNNPELGADGCCDHTDSYYNSFYGYNTTLPTEIGLLKKLQVLKMDNSRFMRHIPSEIGNMRSLLFWRLKGSWTTNQVSGTIPPQMGKLQQLSEFYMENNTISGTIPAEIADLSKLEYFSVQDNKISGTIPDIFDSLSELNLWDTFNNKLEGDLPSSVGRLPDINYLYLQNEHLFCARNYHCRERIENSANQKKYNWVGISRDWINMCEISKCANPFDTEAAFEKLSGDV